MSRIQLSGYFSTEYSIVNFSKLEGKRESKYRKIGNHEQFSKLPLFFLNYYFVNVHNFFKKAVSITLAIRLSFLIQNSFSKEWQLDLWVSTC